MRLSFVSEILSKKSFYLQTGKGYSVDCSRFENHLRFFIPLEYIIILVVYVSKIGCAWQLWWQWGNYSTFRPSWACQLKVGKSLFAWKWLRTGKKRKRNIVIYYKNCSNNIHPSIEIIYSIWEHDFSCFD